MEKVAIPSYSEVLFLLGVFIFKPVIEYLVAIPSYSEVLFLLQTRVDIIRELERVAIPSYSEVLFLQKNNEKRQVARSRNPFLFRGPIPTPGKQKGYRAGFSVAIPSYSEVLFLRGTGDFQCDIL